MALTGRGLLPGSSEAVQDYGVADTRDFTVVPTSRCGTNLLVALRP